MLNDRAPRSRAALLEYLAEFVEQPRFTHPVRVAIDGPDASGKTTLADELALELRNGGRAVIRASIDGFHRPRAERYRRGENSPEGYYEDSFDYPALRRELLMPLGPGGNRVYRRAVFDFRTDTVRAEGTAVAPDDAVLLFDGVFLLRPELVDSWDVRVFVAADFEETLRRALARDEALFGSRDEVERRYRTRYIPGQNLYFADATPLEAADVVINNDDVDRPRLRLTSHAARFEAAREERPKASKSQTKPGC